MFNFELMNCFLLLLPIFLWNLVFAKKLPAEFSEDKNVPQPLKIVEHIFRVLAFFFPIFIPLKIDSLHEQLGLLVFSIGALIYFLCWLPALYFRERKIFEFLLVKLSPAFTPIIWFTGLAIIGNSSIYFIISILFTAVHTYNFYLIFNSKIRMVN